MLGPRLTPCLALLFAVGVNACREQKAGGGAATVSSPSSSATEVVAPVISRAASGEASFDLVALPDGAALAVGDQKGGLAVVLLDRRGVERGAPITLPEVARERVGEVDMASLGSRLALAWVTRLPGGEAAAFAALGDAATRAFAPPLSLGPVTLAPGVESGYVQVAGGTQGEFVVLRRGADEPCAADPGQQCAAFGFRELGVAGAEPRGLPMSVPAPCTRGLAGFVAVEDRWHYGFCSQAEGRALTTHFMRQLQPFYVEVHRSFEGCAPLGATPVGKDALFFADCPSGRRAERVGAMRQAASEIDFSQVDVACESGKPVFRDPGRRFELRLDGPRDGLGPLLPRRLGKGNARAVWTGSHLLTAAATGGSVSVRSYSCRGSLLLGP
jgi:hypothetical protein